MIGFRRLGCFPCLNCPWNESFLCFEHDVSIGHRFRNNFRCSPSSCLDRWLVGWSCVGPATGSRLSSKWPDFNPLRPFHVVMKSSHAQFYFSFPEIYAILCLLTFRPTHTASIDGLSAFHGIQELKWLLLNCPEFFQLRQYCLLVARWHAWLFIAFSVLVHKAK